MQKAQKPAICHFSGTYQPQANNLCNPWNLCATRKRFCYSNNFMYFCSVVSTAEAVMTGQREGRQDIEKTLS